VESINAAPDKTIVIGEIQRIEALDTNINP
jgi:hypothetical protein